ncbi:nicotinamide riboside transporter PnuC [Catenuloplanes sp. NPDC051500]|uniref:nicotinamide riboside transporter PnuC n=1 Tax=Catenuloplanes sp. NPDC051500 TaxID=3363959 RepID=UPI0037973791
MLLDWLNSTAVTAFGAPTSWAEVLGFATGALCVWLVVRQHIANWPLGIANAVMLSLVFLDAALYADAGLQVVYVVLNAYGWWHWARGGNGATLLPVRHTTRAEWIGQVAAGVLITAGLCWWLATHTDSTTELPDAATTALSLMATYGQSRKLLESWWLWITADLIYIPLYGYKGLWLTALLYVLFLGLCVAGLRSWRRAVVPA